MDAFELAIAPELRPRVRVGWVSMHRLGEPLRGELDALVAAEIGRMRTADKGRTAGQIERLGPARSLYRALGLDPTRHRPSPEALLRRVLRGDPFPRVHPAVDLANL
ncbi:MAG: hypothetical protein D6738_08150, partial [Acidobacteria bacterium]